MVNNKLTSIEYNKLTHKPIIESTNKLIFNNCLQLIYYIFV